MLVQLSVKNFAIFKDISVDFHNNFSVITGESGAGKSVFINTLSLLCGTRAYKEMIRTGCEYAIIEGVFSIDSSLRKKLDEITKETITDEYLIISRKINQNQKSICKVNNKIRSLGFLEKISHFLLDIHGQYENQSLLNVDKHLEYLDLYGKKVLDKLLNKYSTSLEIYNKLISELISLSGSSEERERQKELLSFQINEIQSSNVLEINWDEIYNQKKEMDEYEKNKSVLEKTLDLISIDDVSIIENIYESGINLEKNNSMKDISESILDSYYTLKENYSEIKHYLDNLFFDEKEYENVSNIIEDINNIKRKYGATFDKVNAYYTKCCTELELLENYEFSFKKKIIKIKEYEKTLQSLDDELYVTRTSIGKELEKLIDLEFYDLEMKDAKIIMKFQKRVEVNKLGYTKFYEKGNILVEFYIITNKGNEPAPLKRIASGGEISRIMLALKSIISTKDNTPTIIFDEIDSGISGEASIKASLKMVELSKSKQIICISHLPQIIAKGNHHYIIEKYNDEDITYANVKFIEDFEEKVIMLAKIIDGEDLTDYGLKHARTILENKKHSSIGMKNTIAD